MEREKERKMIVEERDKRDTSKERIKRVKKEKKKSVNT